MGMDVHQATISVAVIDAAGKLVLESILETKAATIVQFLGGLGGGLLVTWDPQKPCCSDLSTSLILRGSNKRRGHSEDLCPSYC